MPPLTRILWVAALCAVSRVAWAKHFAELHYERSGAAASCPDELALRNAVAERLGYDPFDSRAETRTWILVAMRRAAGAWEASIRVERRGAVGGERLLASTAASCAELGSTTALTIALALDPLAGIAPSVVPVSPSSPPPAMPPPQGTPDRAEDPFSPRSSDRDAVVRETPRLPLDWRIGAGGAGYVGALPAPGAGVDFLVGIASPHAGLDLEGVVVLPSVANTASGAGVRASLTLGTLSPCLRERWLRVCALASLGVLRGEGVAVEPSHQAAAFYAAAGARVGVEAPLGSRLALDTHLDGLIPVTQTTLGLGTANVWTTPSLSGSLGINLVARFP
jgi:hypothetical protein